MRFAITVTPKGVEQLEVDDEVELDLSDLEAEDVVDLKLRVAELHVHERIAAALEKLGLPG